MELEVVLPSKLLKRKKPNQILQKNTPSKNREEFLQCASGCWPGCVWGGGGESRSWRWMVTGEQSVSVEASEDVNYE